MAYVDYKCLESLLIEGEDLIATEGIGSALKGFFIRFFQNIGKVLKLIANLFTNIAMKFRNKKPSDKRNVEREGNVFRASVVEDFNNSIRSALDYIAATYDRFMDDYIVLLPSRMTDSHKEKFNVIQKRAESCDELVNSCNEKAENVLLALKSCNNRILHSVAQKCSNYCMETSRQINKTIETYDKALNKFIELQNNDVIHYKNTYVAIDIKNTDEYKRMYADLQKSCTQLQAITIKAQKYVSNVTGALNSAIIVYE